MKLTSTHFVIFGMASALVAVFLALDKHPDAALGFGISFGLCQIAAAIMARDKK